MLPWIQIALVIYFCGDASGLRGLRLAVPEAVRSGDVVRLACNYDLEGAYLYSIKWYREDEEFYRYLPKEAPPTRVFPLPGIHVDVSSSDERIVTLLNVDRRSSGLFKCEVSADAPLFHTGIQSALLRVVDVPKGEPEIMTDKVRYASGEHIQANCTVPPSHPAANLTWYLNNNEEQAEYTVVPVGGLEQPLSVLSLDADTGKLSLRCEATLYHVYRGEQAEYTVVPVGGLEQPLSVLSLDADTGKLSLRCEATLYHVYRGVSELDLWQDSPRPASVLGPGHNGDVRQLRVDQLFVSLLPLLLLTTR